MASAARAGVAGTAAILDAFIIGNGPCGMAVAAALTGSVTARYHGPHYIEGVDAKLRGGLGRGGSFFDAGAGALETLTPEAIPYASERSKSPAAVLYDALNHPFVDATHKHYPTLLSYRKDPTGLRVMCVGKGPYGGSWADMPDNLLTLSPGSWMNLPGPSLHEYLPGLDARRRVTRGEVLRYYQAYPSLVGLRSVVHEHVEVVSADLEAAAAGDTPAQLWRIVTRAATPLSADVDADADAATTIYYARNLVLANGMYDRPKRLDGGHNNSHSHDAAAAREGPNLGSCPDGDGVDLDTAADSQKKANAGYYGVRLADGAEDLPFVTHRSPRIGWYKDLPGPPAGAAGGADADRRYLVVVGAGLTAADCISSHLARMAADEPVTILHVFKDVDHSPLAKFKSAKGSGMYDEYNHLLELMTGEARDPRYQSYAGYTLGGVSANQEVTLVPIASGGGGDAAAAAAAPELREVTRVVDRVALLIGSTPAFGFLAPQLRAQVAAMASVVDRKFTLPVDPWTMKVPGISGLYAAGPVRGDNFVRFVVGDGAFITRSILRDRTA